MALTVEVENGSERILGRMRYRFDPGKNGPFTDVDADDLQIIESHPDLTVTVVDADSITEVDSASGSEGVALRQNATTAALDLADENGVDVFALEGTGKGGQVIVADVKAAIDAAPGSAGDEEPDLGPDSTFAEQTVPTTDDSEEEREEVEVAPHGTQDEPPEGGEHYSQGFGSGAGEDS